MCAANNKSRGRMCASAGRVCSPPFQPWFLNGRVPSVKVVLDRVGICRRAPDLDKNSPSWHQRGLHPHGQLGTMLKGFILVLCPLFCISL
jgi:hypothetical protein